MGDKGSVFDQTNNLSMKQAFNETKKSRFEQFDDLEDKEDEGDDWGEDDWDTGPKKVDLAKEDLRNKNLNKLND